MAQEQVELNKTKSTSHRMYEFEGDELEGAKKVRNLAFFVHL